MRDSLLDTLPQPGRTVRPREGVCFECLATFGSVCLFFSSSNVECDAHLLWLLSLLDNAGGWPGPYGLPHGRA